MRLFISIFVTLSNNFSVSFSKYSTSALSISAVFANASSEEYAMHRDALEIDQFPIEQSLRVTGFAHALTGAHW